MDRRAFVRTVPLVVLAAALPPLPVSAAVAPSVPLLVRGTDDLPDNWRQFLDQPSVISHFGPAFMQGATWTWRYNINKDGVVFHERVYLAFIPQGIWEVKSVREDYRLRVELRPYGADVGGCAYPSGPWETVHDESLFPLTLEPIRPLTADDSDKSGVDRVCTPVTVAV